MKAIKCSGTSMSPFIKEGDIVLYDEFKSPLFPDVTCLPSGRRRRGNPPLTPCLTSRCFLLIGRQAPFVKGGIPLLSPPLIKGEERGILRRGDMVVYKINDEIYIHRIISIKNDKFIVSNDDDLEKHTIEKEQILGRVVSRYNGFLGYFLHIFLKTMRQVFRKAKE